jgi:hypothetical protein
MDGTRRRVARRDGHVPRARQPPQRRREWRYRVVDVWESHQAHQVGVQKVILPNMPPDATPLTIECIDLLATVPQR